MRTILSLLVVCYLQSAKAATYYFSSSGNDSRSSTQAKNPSTPWKTISKLNSFFSSLQPGDQVLFKRGETFYGSITISRSGTSGSPIVIGAYGSGSKPVITSLVSLSGWTANSSYKGVYECTNSALGSEVNMVLLNDVQKGIGRYPNSNAANKGYLTFESHYGRSSITDNQLSSSPNWTGAEVVIRASHWLFYRCKITSHSGTKISYTAIDGAREPRNDYGYFMVNSVKALDQLGEWSYNSSTKKLSMFFGSSSPSSYSVKASTINNLVHAGGKSYITFDNLTLKGANEKGFDIHDGSRFLIKNCDVLFSGEDGVNSSGNDNFQIENCTVTNSNNNGIAAGSSNSHAIVRNNTVRNTFTFAGMGNSGEGQGAGIRVGKTGLAEYNRVIKSGFWGISMTGDYCVVKNNFIDSFCFVKDDGGGIYTSNSLELTNTGRKIIGNIILNGFSAREGTDVASLSPSVKGVSSSSGVYMDDNTNNVEISGNTVENCGRGIMLHNANKIIVRGNTFFNNRDEQLYFKHDAMGGLLRNLTVTKNVMFAKISAQLASSVNTNLSNSDISSIGKMDSNYYARPTDNTELIFTTTYLYTSNQVRTWHDLSEWQSKYSKDKVSKLSSKTISSNPDDYIKFVYNASQASKSYSLGATYIDAKGNKYSGSITLQPYTSAALIKDGAITSTDNIAPEVSITSPVTNQSYSSAATINITADASDADGTVSKVDFYNGTTLLNTQANSPYTYSWSNVKSGTYSLTAKATDNKGKVTTSAVVKVTVGSSTGNKAPTVYIKTPVTNTSYSSPATINMTAIATDGDGTISKVEFYNGSKWLHTEFQGTFTYTWKNVPAGTYTITAKATDNDGAITKSAGVKVTVRSTSNKPSHNNESSVVTNNGVTPEKADIGKLKITDFKLYPNPAVNTIHLGFDKFQNYQKATVVINNAAGNILKKYPVVVSGQSLEIDISSLNTGMFTISLMTDNTKMTKKFIKVN